MHKSKNKKEKKSLDLNLRNENVPIFLRIFLIFFTQLSSFYQNVPTFTSISYLFSLFSSFLLFSSFFFLYFPHFFFSTFPLFFVLSRVSFSSQFSSISPKIFPHFQFFPRNPIVGSDTFCNSDRHAQTINHLYISTTPVYLDVGI